MNKFRIFLGIFLFTSVFCRAQDQLFKKDNTKLMVEVIEIGPDEIRYKNADNPTGPVYVVRKSDVAMILYKNGTHETFNTPSPPAPRRDDYYTPEEKLYPPVVKEPNVYKMAKEDSLKYFGHDQSFSINFASFMNMEICGIYQKDFFNSHIGVIIPLGFGVGAPSITQQVYFGNTSQYYYTGSYNRYEIKQKLFEVGIGLNYYPSLKYAVNYYVGPAIRYMQYSGEQTYSSNNGPWGVPSTYLSKKSTLSRYAFTITNGFIFRTRSRLMFNLFGSLGFKNDQLSDVIVDPTTNSRVNPIRNAVSIYFWGGFNLGFCF